MGRYRGVQNLTNHGGGGPRRGGGAGSSNGWSWTTSRWRCAIKYSLVNLDPSPFTTLDLCGVNFGSSWGAPQVIWEGKTNRFFTLLILAWWAFWGTFWCQFDPFWPPLKPILAPVGSPLCDKWLSSEPTRGTRLPLGGLPAGSGSLRPSWGSISDPNWTFWVHLRAILEPLRGIWGPSWSLWGRFWERLGVSNVRLSHDIYIRETNILAHRNNTTKTC